MGLIPVNGIRKVPRKRKKKKKKKVEHNSLLSYLEAKGKVKTATKVQKLKARNLIVKGYTVKQVSRMVRVPVHMVERWCVLFGWEEERDRREYREFRNLRAKLAPNTDLRHDRMAGTLEGLVEKMLRDHAEGRNILKPSELKQLSSIMKDSMEIRRTIRNKDKDGAKEAVSLNLNIPESVGKLADALSAPTKKITPPITTKQINVGNEEGEISTSLEYE